VFFDRSGPKSQSLSAATEKMPSSTPAPPPRNWAALGLAAAMAAPFGVVSIARLQAQEAKPPGDLPPATVQPSSADLLKQARQLFAHRQYEQAQKTLADIKPADLADADRAAYASFALDVKSAVIERRSAQVEVLEGEDALKSERTAEALAHFKAVAQNQYADDATLRKANLRLAALSDAQPQAAPANVVLASDVKPATAQTPSGDLSPRQRYELGLSQYRAGNWAEAKVNLQIAQAAAYQPASIYQDSPTEIIKRIDAREAVNRVPVQRLVQASGNPATPAQTDPLAALKATDDAERVRHDQAVAQASQWVHDAQDAEKQNNFDKALDLYTRAADLDPSNSTAVQGRDHTLVLMGRNPAPVSSGGMDDASRDVRARQGEIRYQISSNLDQARAAISQQNWADAKVAIDRARLAANADPTIFSADEVNRFKSQVDQTELDWQQAQEAARGKAQGAQETAIDKQIHDARIQADRERQRTIADLIRTSQNLTNQGKYREALQTDEQILVLDPKNDYAIGVHPLLEDKVQFQQERHFREEQSRMAGQQFVNSEEALIAYDDILRYPTDWPDLSAMRDLTVAAEHGNGDSDQQAIRQLARVLPQVQFDAVGFSDVVDFLRDISGANIFVNWKVLEAAGIDKNTPVTANLHNVKFSKALDLILDSVGGGQTKLGYTVDEGIFSISTEEDLGKYVAIQVYDIRDLLVSVPDFTDAPQVDLSNTSSQGGGGGGTALGQGGGGGSISSTNSLFQNSNQQSTLRNQGPTRQDLIDSIQKLIEENVATDSWKDNGGSVGSLRVFDPGGQLIVTQTPENHRKLVALLDRIREERAVQVTVETRFLSVQRNFLEDVGVDLNFLFNLNSSWSKKFGTIPLTTPDSTFVQNPSTSVPGSLGSQLTTPTGLTTAATYLDDFQVSLVMRAVEASVNSTIVTAPRVTMFNGQRAYVLVTIQQAYVSNLTPVVSTGVSSFAPTPSNVQSGVLLDVQATVSADRKYVTLTLRPWLSNLLDLVPFTFQGASTAVATGAGTAVAGVSGTIQLPETQITEVKTTVSVPDGGTLLIGGQTVAGQTTREIGVPVLSKIPYLKRLFTSRSIAKDEQILLILVRPTIIMQREIEQKQFPLLTNRLTGG